jgi:hypothetical protein
MLRAFFVLLGVIIRKWSDFEVVAIPVAILVADGRIKVDVICMYI